MFSKIIGSSAKQYCTRFPDGTTIFFRLLTLQEYRRCIIYKDTQPELDLNTFYEDIYNHCVEDRYKDLGGNIKAGVLASIGEFILWASFSTENIEDDIDNTRFKYKTDNNLEFFEDTKRVIMLAFPYTPDDLDKKDRLELIDLFVRAEAMMGLKTQGNYQPVNTRTLRKNEKAAGPSIDFEKENREIGKAGFGKEDTPWGRNSPGQEIKEIRSKAAARSKARQSPKGH